MNLLDRLLVCSNYDLNELYHRISLKHTSKHVNLSQKDAKYFLELAPETISDASFFIAEWLNDKIKKSEMKKVFLHSFDFLTEEELFTVKQLAIRKLKEETGNFVSIIESEFRNIANISNIINLEGFSTFCLQNYRQELFFMIDSCLEEYWSQEEYREFLELLQYFAAFNHSGMRLYINTTPKGQYQLFNENFQDITKQSIERLNRNVGDADGEEDAQNDMLLSLLLLLGPEKIYLYGIGFVKNKNFIKTLKEVFQNKISFYESNLDFLPNKKM